MSIIIHRCSCGHPDIYHQHPQVVDKGGWCSATQCKAREHTLGAPEVIPTFVDGALNEFVHEPGAKLKDLKLCDCAACRALYAEVRNDAEPLRPWYSRESVGADT